MSPLGYLILNYTAISTYRKKRKRKENKFPTLYKISCGIHSINHEALLFHFWPTEHVKYSHWGNSPEQRWVSKPRFFIIIIIIIEFFYSPVPIPLSVSFPTVPHPIHDFPFPHSKRMSSPTPTPREGGSGLEMAKLKQACCVSSGTRFRESTAKSTIEHQERLPWVNISLSRNRQKWPLAL